MTADLRELWNYRELLYIFVQRDLKVRYKNSVLGFGWSLLNPLIQVLTITLVLQFLGVGQRQQNYHMYVFCAMLPWLYFSTALMDSTMSLLGYYQLMRRTYFPRELAPMAVIIANFIHFALATAVFLAYAALNSVFWAVKNGTWDFPLRATVLLLPVPMAGLALLVTGIALFVSVLTLYYEDIRFILDSGLKVLYWLVPVFYFAETILFKQGLPHARLWYSLYMLNPLAALITAFQRLTLVPLKIEVKQSVAVGAPVVGTRIVEMNSEQWLFLLLALISSSLILLAGHRFFVARKWKLVERG